MDQSSNNRLENQRDGQTPGSWAGVLSQFADANIYQTWAYGEVRWGATNLSHLTLKRDGVLVAAAQLRIARLPLLPAGIAYLRWGPLCHRRGAPPELAVVRSMVSALREEYCVRRGLTLQIIPPAFPDCPGGQLFQEALSLEGYCADPVGEPYRTVLVNLTPEPEVMRKRLDQKWRNQLNRSEKNGLELVVSDSAEAYGEFMRLYEGMWQRKQFETSVDVEEFARIQARLGEGEKMHVFLARKDGQPVGALVCSVLGEAGIYLLGATNEQARELKAAYLLQWQAMLWLRQHGARSYDLGGIDPEGNPGGYHFKSGLGGTDITQLPRSTVSGGWLSRGVAGLIAWRRQRSVVKSAAAAMTGP